MATKEPVITIHHSKDIDSKTLQALGEMLTHLWRQVMSKDKSEFEKFKDMAKTVVNVPKEKTRKPKNKPAKKPKKKGGLNGLCVKYVVTKVILLAELTQWKQIVKFAN